MKNPKIDWAPTLKKSCRESLTAVGIFSFIANLLMLVPAFFMLNVYDKAIGSNSVSTLLALSLIAVLMFGGLFAMEALRSRVLVAVSNKIDQIITPLVYEATLQNALRVGAHNASAQPISDFFSLRQFVSGNGAITVFDTPWLPIYLLVMFMFHPVLGWLGVVAALLMIIIAIANQKSTSTSLQEATALHQHHLRVAGRDIANTEVAAAMGMLDVIKRSWRSQQDAIVELQSNASYQSGFFSALTKTFRLGVQSAAIATGAFLVLQQEISPGMLIAGSILVGRALQPIELAVGSWRGFVAARGQYQKLLLLFDQTDWQQDRMSLPKLRGAVSAHQATITPPGSQTPTLRDATFEISPGSTCMIIGPSGAGKSTLIRGILGLWPTSAGDIRIDGAEASHYNRSELGQQIGYLPQDIELFAGSVSSNIARQGEANSADVIAAARDAGIHDLILSFPNGYDTEIGVEGGVQLSPGLRQRLALARALYGRPALVVLDEPNSNLDTSGEMALNGAINTLKAAGSTVVIVRCHEVSGSCNRSHVRCGGG
ncbi:MAG: type I secretion system permease/ATPase [Proteobacteria bacterium]|nr:type I secretion system permease/ATPase [Pseudomonadota bacterium]